MAWSAVTMAVLVVVLRRGQRVRAVLRSPRARWLLLLAAALISANWGMFIYGVNSGQVVEVIRGTLTI